MPAEVDVRDDGDAAHAKRPGTGRSRGASWRADPLAHCGRVRGALAAVRTEARRDLDRVAGRGV
jgi:hypothetical protein